jgi:hypothetical protein
MAERPDYGRLGPRVPGKCKEGNVTIHTGSPVGGDVKVPVFTNPIKAGDWVKLVGDNLYEKCGAGDSPIGRAVGTPQWKGKQPTADATWGNYEPRRVAIELMGTAVKTVTLEAANTEITAGKSVKVGATTAQRYDLFHAANLNNTRALVGAAANSAAEIPVLFGFYGVSS